MLSILVITKLKIKLIGIVIEMDTLSLSHQCLTVYRVCLQSVSRRDLTDA